MHQWSCNPLTRQDGAPPGTRTPNPLFKCQVFSGLLRSALMLVNIHPAALGGLLLFVIMPLRYAWLLLAGPDR
jgi:hypothetical protein